VARWSQLAERHRIDGLPDRNVEYLLFQTLVGAWPISVERAVAYMRKAAHEAKRHTTWTAPNPRYDAALAAFVRGVLEDAALTADLAAFVDTLEDAARRTSLALLLLRLTAPGVPDIYQGSELWERSLVDPDNRRPVDFGARRRLLDEAGPMTAADAWRRAGEGIAKLWLLRRVLALRTRRPELFAGSYLPLAVEGSCGDRVVAFLRDGSLAVVAPRLVAGLSSWGDAALQLPEGSWHDVLQDRQVHGRVSLAELLATFPVALLERR
jgi:(1->4)-alpha-D-glucan 1-alpha-D-glucosylmutase